MFAQTLTDSQRPDLQLSEQVKVENHGPALAESYILSSPIVEDIMLFMEAPNETSMRALREIEEGDVIAYDDMEDFKSRTRLVACLADNGSRVVSR